MNNKEMRILDIKHYLLSFLFPSYQIFAPQNFREIIIVNVTIIPFISEGSGLL